jgi:hypothetical protein
VGNASIGARIKGPRNIECEACGKAKARRQIQRVPRDIKQEPGAQLAIDFHDFEQSSIGDYKCLMLVMDRYTGLMWDYYLPNHQGETILAALKHLFGYLNRQFKIKPQKIECDNEILMRPIVREWLEEDQYVVIEPSPPHVKEPDGAAERSGGVVKDKARAMRIDSKLPEDLAPEIFRAAVYLQNRTPRYQYDWKSPYERFHAYIANRDGALRKDSKPQVAHLRVYGCKAFALTTEYLKKEKRLQRFNPKAWIGYLIGYDSTNIYRIWNPLTNKIVRARDVIFNEDEVFTGNLERLRDDIKDISLPELAELLQEVDISEIEDVSIDENEDLPPSITSDSMLLANPLTIDEALGKRPNLYFDYIESSPLIGREQQESGTSQDNNGLLGYLNAYLISPDTLPAALLAATI